MANPAKDKPRPGAAAKAGKAPASAGAKAAVV